MSDNGTAELIGLMREVNHAVNALTARVDRHMAETNTRIEALQLDVAEEKKSGNDWLTSWLMYSDVSKN